MRSKRNVIIMCAISLLQGMVFYGPIATLYRQAVGVTIFQITLIESVSLALCVLLELPWGIVADRIGYKNSMLLCCGIYFASKLVFWRADGFAMFLVERVMLSVVLAGLSGVDASILYLSAGEERAQWAFGLYGSLGTAGLLAAALAYSVFIGDDYRLAGLMTVISYGLAAALACALRDVKSEARKRGGEMREFASILRQLVKNKGLLALVLAAALLTEANQTITVFLSQPQYVRCGLSTRAMGAIYIAITLVSLAGGLSARLTRRLGERRTGVWLFSGGLVACAALAATGSAVVSVAAIALLRICYSLMQPLAASIQNRQVTSPNRATALSLNAVLMEAVAIGTNLIYGRAADKSLPLAFIFGAATCLAALALYIYGCGRFSKSESA